ncbi:uncharacterized protein LOC127122961 [Lathyrus oleraceus]|uniref:uncharacterized protein LOC127122961 n=1 Tax=Pisum sativum TaxID=3888 RepID=UPI0021D0C29D|nr:uncharacterized protein LOC127122961 [Pisum sativum]
MRLDIPYEYVMYIRDYEIQGPDEGPEPGSRWTLVFDGASNALGNGIRVVITSPTYHNIPFTTRLYFKCTNNMAKYETCILGIKETINLRMYEDSTLIIYQVKGDWETRYSNLISYRDHVLKLIPYFDEITFHHIPREENQLVDALATFSYMLKIKWGNEAPCITIQHLDEPTHCLVVEIGTDGEPWFYDIKKYLEKHKYPKNVSSQTRRP